ncbi:MAG: hypothetical protein PF690_00470 [Deltaproteobacteria bacterium]|jgi:hypothetical protein|nr:hypothetical protein [Deltaproteobacteria bacterium]
MKITDPDVIKNGEKDLIQAVKDDLDLDIIKRIMQNKMNAESISSKGGEIVVHNNKIAFRLDFSIEISGSLMFDRQGNYISEPDGEDVLPIDDFDTFTDEPDPETDLEPDLEADLEPDLEAKIEDDLYLKPEMGTSSDYESETELKGEPESEISENDDIQDDIVDEEIDDILKESRDFWENKKDE